MNVARFYPTIVFTSQEMARSVPAPILQVCFAFCMPGSSSAHW